MVQEDISSPGTLTTLALHYSWTHSHTVLPPCLPSSRTTLARNKSVLVHLHLFRAAADSPGTHPATSWHCARRRWAQPAALSARPLHTAGGWAPPSGSRKPGTRTFIDSFTVEMYEMQWNSSHNVSLFFRKNIYKKNNVKVYLKQRKNISTNHCTTLSQCWIYKKTKSRL